MNCSAIYNSRETSRIEFNLCYPVLFLSNFQVYLVQLLEAAKETELVLFDISGILHLKMVFSQGASNCLDHKSLRWNFEMPTVTSTVDGHENKGSLRQKNSIIKYWRVVGGSN